MEECLNELKKAWKNLKKSPNRKYTEKTVIEKIEQINSIKREFELAEIECKEKLKVVALKLEFNSLHKLIKEYLENSIKESKDIIDSNMANFNLETVSKTIPLFSGNHEELESFIITAELIEKTLSENAKQDFLQYIYHAKLTSNVRTAVGTYIKPENFSILKDLLQQRYKSTKTIPELQNKLNNIFQGKMSINMFKERITSLIDNLNKLGIEELGQTATEAEKNVIIRLNNKLALDCFKKGINPNYKPTLYAARPSTLQEATNLALELENEYKLTSNTVLHFNKQRNNNRNFDFNRNNSNFNRNNNNNFNKTNNYFNRNNNNNFNKNNNNNFNKNNNNNFNRNNNNSNRNNTFTGNNGRNQNHPNRNFRNNNRNYVHTINNAGNSTGSEYISIPDSQN